MTTDGLGSVRRALDILRVLGDRPLRVQAVAAAIGREKSQVSRSLKLLADAGFVERDPETQEYRLGWQLFALARSAGDQRLVGDAPGVLRRLVLDVGEPAYLSVLQGAAALTVLTEHPARSRSLQARDWVGRSAPLTCTAAGRTLLLGLPDAEVAALAGTYGDPLPGTGRSPRDTAEVLRRLRAERAQGYVTVVEEYEPGLVAVAAPVRDLTGQVTASVNVSAPVFRMSPDGLGPVVTAVRAAADRLSATLGHRP
ncbi:MAG: helix-turn-helix domain-containing protein [Streptosporangiales bacterium]|nr:helix-turn-helix domain-containing protein [Streptosporangiales bacterium]